MDSEGGVQAQESKTRFIAPVISLLLASKSADNDAGHHSALGASGSAATSGANANVSGRTLGGVSGFGLLGAAVSQSSPYVGMAFGYYGLAWSVYSNVIAKGGEVQFEKRNDGHSFWGTGAGACFAISRGSGARFALNTATLNLEISQDEMIREVQSIETSTQTASANC